MEIWDVYDDCFIKTGKTTNKRKELEEGENHLIAHVYPVNNKGEILIQQRNKAMRWKPGRWAATSGSAISSEDGFMTCQRELYEELGIKSTKENTTFAFMNKRKDHFCTVWIVETDVNIEDLVLQPAEVIDVKWATPDEIRKMIKKKEFLNYYYIEQLFDFIDKYI